MDDVDAKTSKPCAESQKVFFLNDYVAKAGTELISLRNPGNGKSAKYVFHQKSNEFFEVLKYSEPFRSWFVGEVITNDGGIYLIAPIDPIFLLLHYVRKEASEKFVPLEHILIDETYGNNMVVLGSAISTEQLNLIADQKGDSKLKAVKYNKEKTIYWLAYKLKQLQDALRERKLNVESGATSSTFVASEKFNDQQDDDIKLLAFGIISDYLSKELVDDLAVYLNLEAIKSKKRKQNSDDAINSANKKIKLSIDSEEAVIPSSQAPAVAEKKISAKAKQLAKSAKGSKNIMSFFKSK